MVLMKQGVMVGCACNDLIPIHNGEAMQCRDCSSILSPAQIKPVCMIQPNCLRPANRWVYNNRTVIGPMCALHARAWADTHITGGWRTTSDPDNLGGAK